MLEGLTKKLNSFIEPLRKNQRKNMMSFDLLYQLSYMSVIAAGGVPRAQIFERAAKLPCTAADYFNRIELASKRLKYDYAQACRLVGESAEDESIKALLLRFSSSLISGEPEAEFLAREAEAQADNYDNEYGRNLEAMKMWTDAYVSLILSAVLVIIIGIVSTMIWRIETGLIIAMAFIAIMTTATGVWLIYVVSPKETMVLSWAGSREQQIARRLLRYTLPLAVIFGLGLLILKINMGWALLAAAALVFPVGFVMTADDQKVTRRDSEVGTFLRSLGGVCAALGTTVNSALNRLDLDSINNLRVAVKALRTRLVAGIKSRLCWSRFIDETGSELTNRSVGMFYDAIDMGGSAGAAGYQASLYASKIALLRARRKTVAGPFRWLCIAMHGSVVVLLIFVSEVIMAFAGMVSQAQQSLPRVSGAPSMGSLTSFNLSGLEVMHSLVIPLVLIFTVANAIAPMLADGGSKFKIFFNLGVTAAISGLSIVVLPTVAKALFLSAEM
ncbi:MAG: hypothetical protein PHR43_04965 [Dehalococcoidales bacterium]|nr:hypothetical protein [Dehalococcoidales bacterium]